MSLFGAVFLNANVLSDATITGIKVVNTRSLLGINAYHYLARVEVNDMYVENADTTEKFIINFNSVHEMVLNNVTINHNDISSTDPTGIIYLGPRDNGTATISNFTIMNSDIGDKHAIDYRQLGYDNITIENLYVQNVTLGTDTKIIKTQASSSFYLKNSTFIDVKPQDLGDSTPKLVDLPSLLLNNESVFSLQDTYIENCKVGFIELLGLKN